MGIRSTLVGLVASPTRRAMQGEIREMIESALASRNFARAADVAALREKVERPEDHRVDDLVKELAAVKARVTSLEKQLGMAMGGLQTVSSDLVTVRANAEAATASARQAAQQATSARSTAEAASDGVAGLESQFARLTENLGAPTADAPPKPKRPKRTPG